MNSDEIKKILNKQREFYKTGATIPVKYRIEQLKNSMVQ